LSLALAGALCLATACGSGRSSSGAANSASTGTSAPSTGGSGGNTIAASASNVAALTVNTGPNFLFTTVTVCAPGTATCATIPDVLVDTGSFGLRLLASPQNAIGTPVSSLGLPQVNAPNNAPLVECVTFLDQSFVWGPVRRADVTLSGEKAANIPIQIIGDSQFLNDVPSDCGDGNVAHNENSFQTLGANGILGIGLFMEDCGRACAPPNPPVPQLYYACAAGGAGTCLGYLNGDPRNTTSVSLVNQVSNPVASFVQDNNGTIIELPAVGAGGASSVAGSLVFGIGTQANNDLGNATVLTAVPTGGGSGSGLAGTFTTLFGGQSFPDSFIDSGSNGFYFLDSSLVATLSGGSLPTCTQSGQFSNDAFITSFYCGNFSSSATNQGTNGNSTVVQIGVANAEIQFLTGNQVFNNIAGPISSGVAGPNSAGPFDWGMPFFFGRNIYTAIEGVSPPQGVPEGPFWAY
jgi:hypothetical protein